MVSTLTVPYAAPPSVIVLGHARNKPFPAIDMAGSGSPDRSRYLTFVAPAAAILAVFLTGKPLRRSKSHS